MPFHLPATGISIVILPPSERARQFLISQGHTATPILPEFWRAKNGRLIPPNFTLSNGYKT
ncbi:MAG: hypothetical protein ONB48_03995 [candidate division KSB1 bacterium]|nr:hypothetical protein [candidate division KSB1 bacterium]MDZ7274528.1 hypothetical protein [candidate division KSB1 bacterium]MDZ7284811.1 hypothetical protein [candidate division KSB1 bacterium]MDZ7297769.1 hypothetical protein [candidate division KSB1 bacterium]MDZ7306442.1 hypothetical protein [candidate division KSB1 bacterium]